MEICINLKGKQIFITRNFFARKLTLFKYFLKQMTKNIFQILSNLVEAVKKTINYSF